MFKKLVAATVLALALTGTAAGAASAATPTPSPYSATVDGVVVDDPAITTPAQLQALLQSRTPKTLTMDVTTGRVTKVSTQAQAAPLAALINNPCLSTDLCAYHYSTPWADYGFSSAGAYTGTWAHRGGVLTRGWYGQWHFSTGADSPWVSPNTQVVFNMESTLTRVQLQTTAV